MITNEQYLRLVDEFRRTHGCTWDEAHREVSRNLLIEMQGIALPGVSREPV